MEKEVLVFDCYKSNVNDILRHLHSELGFYLDILDKRVEYHSPTGLSERLASKFIYTLTSIINT